ncbi:MAG: diadenylate cyclase [Spirochaetes bacterium]|nr:diadenylate cyclase [Spirochaetota bacterium]
MQEFLSEITVIDALDIIVVSMMVYFLFLWFKKTRAVFTFAGIVIFSIIYMFIRLLRFRLTTALLQGFFAVILVAIVILFQREIRRLFEQIALWSLNSRFKKKGKERAYPVYLKIIGDTLRDLGHARIGALIVMEGKEPVLRHLSRGVDINGDISEGLLKSIFDTHSIGHDGAVIIQEDKVLRFGCLLPLSREWDKFRKKGSRHAAALGLSERTDALCLVASEETGDVSVCRNGRITRINNRNKLLRLLADFQNEISPSQTSSLIRDFFTRNIKEKFIAIVVSLALWFVVIYESVTIYKTFEIPVRYMGLDRGYRVKRVRPGEVKVVLSGRRRDFYFINEEDIRLELKLFDVDDEMKQKKKEYHEVILTASDFELPTDLTMVNILPRSIRLNIISTEKAVK